MSTRDFSPTYYQAMAWRNIGPFRGGRSVAVAGVAGDPETYYFGGAGGGVFKTSNSGATWTNITDGFLKTSSVGAIAVAPSDANVVYVGMGEGSARSAAISEGDGVYKSTDAGRTWTHAGLEATRVISRILIHPTNPDLIYVAAQGSLYAPSKDRGIYRSKDGGATWQRILFVNETAGAADLAMDPRNPRILYAAFWDRQRQPWGMRSIGAGSGIYKSTDFGDTWKKIDQGLPEAMGKIGIAVSANSDRLYAIVESADPKGGLYRSDDAGKTWKLLNTSADLMSRPYYYMRLACDPKNPDVVWELDMLLWKSIDGGKSFAPVQPAHSDTHDLWINPNDAKRMILADDGGGAVTENGGANWSSENTQPTGQIYRVNTDDKFPYRVYGAQQDAGTIAIKSWSSRAAIGWDDWKAVGGCESAFVALNPKAPSPIYAGCYLGEITRLNTGNDSLHYVMPNPGLPVAFPLKDMQYRFNWSPPLVVSGHDGTTIYAAAQMVLRSKDRGNSWQQISPDMTNWAKDPTGAGDRPLDGVGGETYHTIFYVAESPLSAKVLWTGSDDGVIGLTRDGGATWSRFALPGIAEARSNKAEGNTSGDDAIQINAIEASPYDAATAYVAATRYKLEDQSPYIFRTRDFGKSWEKITTGIPANDWVHVVREDPERKGLLYAGTETGAYVSFDDGGHWQSLQLNLPVTPITGLQVHGTDLVAATMGRAFWILDDVTPLRQMDAKAGSSGAFLFTPRAAIRTNLGSARFELAKMITAVPPQEGKNPPYGAILDFYIGKKMPVTIQIQNAAGETVRTFSTESKPKTEGMQNEVVPLKVKEGANRIVWDLRRAMPAGPIPGVGVFRAMQGRYAVPGEYTVRMDAGGQVRTATLHVLADPRFKATPQQYAEQDQFLASVENELSDLYGTVRRIRSVHSQIEDVGKMSKNAAVVKAGKALEEKMSAVEGEMMQEKALGIRVLMEPAKLDSDLNALGFEANSPDAEVTATERSYFAEISKKWLSYKSRADRLLGPELDAFNAQVRQEKIPAVVVPQ